MENLVSFHALQAQTSDKRVYAEICIVPDHPGTPVDLRAHLVYFPLPKKAPRPASYRLDNLKDMF